MVDFTGFDKVNAPKVLSMNDFRVGNVKPISQDDVSIFDANNNSEEIQSVEALEAELLEIENKQGLISNVWNEIKEFTGVGMTVDKCDMAIEKYKNGEITYEEALAEIEKFDEKQANSLDLFANITTGVTSILAGTAAAAAVIASGGTATPLVVAALAGAGAGAVTKSGVKLTDRATNAIKDDALNGKQIAKDAISGAITGAISGATMGNGTTASTVAKSVQISATRSAKTGLITGSISGSTGYILDSAFDENKDFNMGELAISTATGALISGTVGTIVGSTNGFLRGNNVIKNGGMVKAATDNAGNTIVANASKEAIIANSACSTGHKITNRMIRDMGDTFVA